VNECLERPAVYNMHAHGYVRCSDAKKLPFDNVDPGARNEVDLSLLQFVVKGRGNVVVV
jgi:hypothetical protein